MARPLRIEVPSAVYHVMNRGMARQAIFRDPGDYETFLEGVYHMPVEALRTGQRGHANEVRNVAMYLVKRLLISPWPRRRRGLG